MSDRNPRISSTRKLRLGAESDQADREFWASLTPEQRVEETWRLSVELWEVNGWDIGEPGRREPSLRTFLK
jgi:hypothetical protein